MEIWNSKWVVWVHENYVQVDMEKSWIEGLLAKQLSGFHAILIAALK